MKLLSFFCFLFAISGYAQMNIDSTEATILFEIKKDTSGKYIKRTFKDLSTGNIYEFEANPEKFSFELREDVIKYLRRKQKKENEKKLNGLWKLKSANDFSRKNIALLADYEIIESMEFHSGTGMFIKKTSSGSTNYTGCYFFNKKDGTIFIQTTRDSSLVKLPKKADNKFPEQCIKPEAEILDETLFLYTLDSDYLTLYMFIPTTENEEFDQTIFLNYIKVYN